MEYAIAAIPIDSKVCSGCNLTKLRGDFPALKRVRSGMHPMCLDCRRAYARAYWKEHYVPHPRSVRVSKKCSACGFVKNLEEFYPARAKNSGSGRQSFCIACTKARQMLRFYGLTESDYAALLDAQNGLCAICQDPLGEKPQIDHCHETGFVRGILCKGCNNGIGRIERHGFLDRAVAYLVRASNLDASTAKRGSRVGGNRSAAFSGKWEPPSDMWAKASGDVQWHK